MQFSLQAGATEQVSMEEFRFTRATFDILCSKAKAGELEAFTTIIESISCEDKARFTTESLCPDPSLHLTSPFVVAAQHGHLNVLKYLNKTFPGLIDVNRGASIVSKRQNITTHRVPPLVAACTCNNIAVVKYLLEEMGADINKRSLTGANAVRAAAYYGYIEIIDYLLEHGADIDRPNCIGSSPLLAAAHSGGAEAIRFLIKKGANTEQRTIEGYTAIHEAAHKGDVKAVEVLLELGMSPYFSLSHPKPEHYVPCPLFLAASVGNKEVFDLLINHPSCPLECKADAYLLLAVSFQTYDEPGAECFDNWSKGLEIMAQLDPPLPTLPPKPEYSNLKEVRSQSELQTLWDNYTINGRLTELPLQCLIVKERCMGILDQSLIDAVIKEGMQLLYSGNFNESERLLLYAMYLEEQISEFECNHPEYGYCDGILQDLEIILDNFVYTFPAIHQIYSTSNLKRLFQFGLNLLSYLDKLKRTKADGETIVFTGIMDTLVKLLHAWILLDHNEFVAASNLKHSSTVCSHDLVHYPSTKGCRELVEHCATLPVKYNILVALMKVMPSFPSGTQIIALTLETLLSCGADQYINSYAPNGYTILSYLFDLEIKTVMACCSVLLEYGIHLDMVDINGRTYRSKDPLRLQCLASRAIVNTGIEYTSVGLPAHVVSFVKLHDPKFVPVVQSPEEKYFGKI